MVGKAGAPKVLLGQRIALNHGAHGAVENQQALAEQFGKAVARSLCFTFRDGGEGGGDRHFFRVD